LEYEFTIVYKLDRTRVVVDALSILLDNFKPLGVLDHIVDASFFFVEPKWINKGKTYLEIGQMLKTLNRAQK
jgi:hypothetical protein